MIIPKALNPWNLIVTITYLRTNIPKEIINASKIDGCNDFKFIIHILLSLSKPIIAVMALFYAVGHWNTFFDAMIYINTASKFPLQLVLREILLQNSLTVDMMSNMKLTAEEMAQRMSLSEQLKYALIIVASVPLMIFYPFVQKYFIKGIMVGSIKG
jgi:multiple sugar transport system permease protein/putative aldouronate transport system permease protein